MKRGRAKRGPKLLVYIYRYATHVLHGTLLGETFSERNPQQIAELDDFIVTV